MQMLLEIKNRAEKMVLDHDVDVPMRDGAHIKANVFRPQAPGSYPVLITFGPYGKDIHFSANSPAPWEDLTQNHPDVFRDSSGKYMAFETPDFAAASCNAGGAMCVASSMDSPTRPSRTCSLASVSLARST